MNNRFFKVLNSLLGPLCAVVFLALLVDVLWGVFTRYVLRDQARWTEELARFLMVWLAFLGAALAYVHRQHLGVDVLVARFEPGARRLAERIEHGLVLLFAVVVLGAGGWELFRDRLASGQTMPVTGISKAWQYLCVPVSGALMALVAAGHLFATWRQPVEAGDEESKEVAP